MANIPSANPFLIHGAAPVLPTVLGLNNTLTYRGAARQVLFVRNMSDASITVTLKGSLAPTALKVSGTGLQEDLSAGKVFTIAAGAIWQIALSNYREYLPGDVTLTSSVATDVVAWITEV